MAPLDDLNVRTAIQMAIDKESIAQNIYSGLRTKADSVMPADMPYCTATVSTPDYDMDGAIALLEGSGWVDSNGDGIREKDGTVLSFTITYPSTGVYDNMVLFFQSSMAELGIEIKTNPIDLMAFMQQVFMEDNYEMTAYMSYWFPYDPYTFVANMYPSTDYADPSRYLLYRSAGRKGPGYHERRGSQGTDWRALQHRRSRSRSGDLYCGAGLRQ